jgi:hypothetical protein
MNRRIARVLTGMVMIAGVAAMSVATAGMAAADGGRSSQLSNGREWSTDDSSIFTVNYGYRSGDGREFGREFGHEFSVRDQSARDQ